VVLGLFSAEMHTKVKQKGTNKPRYKRESRY